jgi:hypothetical protein
LIDLFFNAVPALSLVAIIFGLCLIVGEYNAELSHDVMQRKVAELMKWNTDLQSILQDTFSARCNENKSNDNQKVYLYLYLYLKKKKNSTLCTSINKMLFLVVG